MSCSNGGSSVGSLLGALLTSMLSISATNFQNLPWLVCLCAAGQLIPLTCIHYIRESNEPQHGILIVEPIDL